MRQAMTRRRIIGLAGCLTVGIVVLVLVLNGRDNSHAVLEGGARTATVQGVTGPSVAAPATTSVPASTVSTGDRRQSAAAARAAARLFLVGLGGTQAPPEVLQSFAEHEWGGVVLEPGNGESPQQVADLIGTIQGTARNAGHLTPLVAASQLGGERDAVPVGSRPQAAAANPAEALAAARGAAKALLPLGVRMVLAPDADIATAGGPWEGLAFSDDPGTAAGMVAAAVLGWKAGRVAPVPGHFPGEGAASGDPALEAATVGIALDELKARDLQPFAAIAKTAPAIQLSAATYVAFDGVTPATLLPEVVAMLRGELGFGGVIVSGDLAAASLSGGESVAQLAVRALQAGVDLLWIPGDVAAQDAAWRAVVRALRDGTIPASRVNDALARVSKLRAAYGVK
jgi:beta-N-acetylhexosaminidase